MIVASAPGKLMLAGEYVVARGLAPALAVAVDRRARVRLRPGGPWRVSSAALGLSEAPVGAVPVVAEAIAAAGCEEVAGHVVVESDLGSGRLKPGLGGSAAICVAALGAVRAAAGQGAPDLEEVIRAHGTAQSGRGSGYDVATALLGGVCLYQPGPRPRGEALCWPPELHAAVLFAGRGSRTTARLERLEAAEARDRRAVEGALERQAVAARGLVFAWRGGDAAAVADAARLAEAALRGLDWVAGIGVDEGGVGPLRAVLEDGGVAARTSGAGGGDCVWALDEDAERLAAVVARAQALGYDVVDVTWPGRGLAVRQEEERA